MHPTRRGVTLIEMAVVISLQAVLLAVAVAFIGRMLEADRKHREQVQALSSLHSLADQFRRDVHEAKHATPGDGSLEMHLPADLVVRYEAAEGRVHRVEHRGNHLVRRELFRLSRDWPVAFEEASTGPRPEVRMTVSDWSWEAVIGKEEPR